MPFLKSLNPNQHEAAIASDGPLLLLAGAGTGKTRVLTTRIAHLIRDKGVSPGSILAVTFTNKAAGEMRERLTSLLGADLTRGLWLGTFHSFGLRVLRMEGARLDIGPNFTIYNDDDQIALIKLVLKELNMSDKAFSPRALSTKINQAKNELIAPDDYLLEGKDFLSERVARVYKLYQEKLTEMKAADFGDLISAPIRLFREHPDVLERYQRRFSHILVDEYQDTNKAQYLLMNMLASLNRNICVVGDPDQSIYGWRGADIRNILDFQADWEDASVIRLEQNYRSTSNILSAANSIIKNNVERMEKNLWTENDDGALVKCIDAMDEREEVFKVASSFREVLAAETKLGYKDVAVFYRTNAQSRVFEEYFIREGIPYHVVGGLRFYDRKEIKDALALLRLVANPDDTISFRRVVNTPPRGMGKASVDKVEALAAREALGLVDACEAALSSGLLRKKALAAFVKAYRAFGADIERLPIHELAMRLIEDTGYMGSLMEEGSEESLERADNLHELVSAIKDFESVTSEATLASYLDQVALISDIDSYEDRDERVTLMTLHSAKGLEFPIVFLTGMEEGLFPHRRSIDSPAEMEEERRLCYVGMTRAGRFLFLSSSGSRSVYGETRFQLKSRFIDEIDPAYLDTGTPVSSGRGPAGEYYTIDESQLDDVYSEPSYDSDFLDVPSAPSWSVGMRVVHPTLGFGVIRAREGMGEEAKLTINFKGSGPKKLIVKHADLRPAG